MKSRAPSLPAMLASALAFGLLCLAGAGCQTTQKVSDAISDCGPGRSDPRAELRAAITLHAPFDGGTKASFALGDPVLYTAPASNQRTNAVPGLPEGDLVQLAASAGRHGDALRFTKKMKPLLFFRGATNLAYRATNWSGSASFWLKLDPDKDLEPGYCDPLQFVAQAWGEGNMFVEFSKDHTPRHFRYAILPVTKLWNPDNRKWEEIPDAQRPMAPVYQPPFSREKWTHVLFTFANVNTGRKDGIGKLYLNGELQGSFTGFETSFNWDAAQSAITFGLNYVGLFDDLTIFNRDLTADEVKTVYNFKDGTSELLQKQRECVFRCLKARLWPTGGCCRCCCAGGATAKQQ